MFLALTMVVLDLNFAAAARDNHGDFSNKTRIFGGILLDGNMYRCFCWYQDSIYVSLHKCLGSAKYSALFIGYVEEIGFTKCALDP